MRREPPRGRNKAQARESKRIEPQMDRGKRKHQLHSRGVERVLPTPQRRRRETRRPRWKRGKEEHTTIALRPSSLEKNLGPAALPASLDPPIEKTIMRLRMGSGPHVARPTAGTRLCPALRIEIRLRTSRCTFGQYSPPLTARPDRGPPLREECGVVDGTYLGCTVRNFPSQTCEPVPVGVLVYVT